MKKQLVTLAASILLFALLSCTTAAAADISNANPSASTGFAININGDNMNKTSIIRNGVHYVPLRTVFERLGAFVFYRSRDRQIYALSRDGDTIQHIVGSSTATINDVQKTFRYSSFSEGGVTYVPVEMIGILFRTNDIFHDHNTKELRIKKPFPYTEHNKLVNDVLCVCRSSNFYPEKFKRYLNYHTKNPASTMQDVIFMVNLGLDYPFYCNVATAVNPYSHTVLVNKYNKLPAGFNQNNLVQMEWKYTNGDGKQFLMESTAYQKFVQMANAASKDGVSIKAASTYRTEAYQSSLYDKNLRTTGQRNADNYSARPGFSEHQTGLAVDINYTGASFEHTAAFKWLQLHAHEYGYILRYPKGKTWITGYAYEPWHYRYVGVDNATIMHNEGTTYEQHYVKYIAVNEFK